MYIYFYIYTRILSYRKHVGLSESRRPALLDTATIKVSWTMIDELLTLAMTQWIAMDPIVHSHSKLARIVMKVEPP